MKHQLMTWLLLRNMATNAQCFSTIQKIYSSTVPRFSIFQASDNFMVSSQLFGERKTSPVFEAVLFSPRGDAERKRGSETRTAQLRAVRAENPLWSQEDYLLTKAS
jgi:hypothetical protein